MNRLRQHWKTLNAENFTAQHLGRQPRQEGGFGAAGLVVVSGGLAAYGVYCYWLVRFARM